MIRRRNDAIISINCTRNIYTSTISYMPNKIAIIVCEQWTNLVDIIVSSMDKLMMVSFPLLVYYLSPQTTECFKLTCFHNLGQLKLLGCGNVLLTTTFWIWTVTLFFSRFQVFGQTIDCCVILQILLMVHYLPTTLCSDIY